MKVGKLSPQRNGAWSKGACDGLIAGKVAINWSENEWAREAIRICNYVGRLIDSFPPITVSVRG